MKKLTWIILGLMTLFMGCEDDNEWNYQTPKFTVKDLVSYIGTDYDSVLAKYPYAIKAEGGLHMKSIYEKTGRSCFHSFSFEGNKVNVIDMGMVADNEFLINQAVAFALETSSFAAMDGPILAQYNNEEGPHSNLEFETVESFKQWEESVTDKRRIMSINVNMVYGQANPIPMYVYYDLDNKEDGTFDCDCIICIGNTYND